VAAVTDSHETVGLKANAVNLWGDFVVSIANVAPSSSVAFTLALLVGFTGFSSPLAVLIVGIAMFLVSMGYAALNRWKPSAGAPYVWVGEAINPTVGYGTGFLNSLTSTLANVGNITLAGTYLLFVITPTHTFAKPITWLVATAIIGVLLWLAIRGIRPTVWVQIGFVVIEYGAVIAFVILALIHEASGQGGATLPSLSDFTVARVVGDVGGFKGLAEAAVVCGFLYLGWEAPAVLGEESTKAKINPGRAMMLGTGFLTVWYTFLIIVFQGVSSQKDVLAHGTDILAYAGTLLVPGFFGRALPLAVLIAVLGTSQIQMVEPSAVRHGPGPPDPEVLRPHPPGAPDSLGIPVHTGRDTAPGPDPVPREHVREQGHRLCHQRDRHARAVHVLRHRAEQRVVLPVRAGPRRGRGSHQGCAAAGRGPVHGPDLLLRAHHPGARGRMGVRGRDRAGLCAGHHRPPGGSRAGQA
jgi:hypothetical protein